MNGSEGESIPSLSITLEVVLQYLYFMQCLQADVLSEMVDVTPSVSLCQTLWEEAQE